MALPGLVKTHISVKIINRGVFLIDIEAIEIANWINDNFEMLRVAYPNEDIKNLLGIITPFKAQVSCIRSDINSKIPEHIKKNISIGTVHTFQGAERRIIIMSTVYGESENCVFIDPKEKRFYYMKMKY